MSKAYGLSILNLGYTGKNRDTKRVWIANRNITKSFNINDLVNISYDKEEKEIVIEKAEILANHTISSRNGKEPIIDIKNKKVNDVFDGVEKVEVFFFDNKIVIKVAKSELRKVKAQGNTNNRIFELFAGGATLSHCFKMAGFKVAGALELEDKYLKMFHLNNQEDEIYTITANIEDMDPSDYPKDIGTMLIGIPCTTFTKSNLKMTKGLKEKNEKSLQERYSAEALTFYVIEAIRAMVPKNIVIEEVVEYSKTNASYMLRTVLETMGYKLSEKISTGSHTKRKRWALVATMSKTAIGLENLIPETNVTIGDLADINAPHRNWREAGDHIRVAGMIRKNLGVRDVSPCDTMTNTFTGHGTRSTEPVYSMIREDGVKVFDEFTNEEIKTIHGLNGYRLSGVKTLDRQILGQGVTDMFYYIARRIMGNLQQTQEVL